MLHAIRKSVLYLLTEVEFLKLTNACDQRANQVSGDQKSFARIERFLRCLTVFLLRGTPLDV